MANSLCGHNLFSGGDGWVGLEGLKKSQKGLLGKHEKDQQFSSQLTSEQTTSSKLVVTVIPTIQRKI